MPLPLTIEQINNKKPIKSRLTAISFGETRILGSKKNRTIVCKCECGTIKEVLIKCFLNTTFSCGCYNLELVTKLGKGLKYDSIEKIRELVLTDNKLYPLRFLQPKINKKGYKLPVIECRCECGKVVPVDMYHFVNNQIKSCGCLLVQSCKDNFTKYPGNIKQIRASYDAMMRRCYSHKCESYSFYGGRGVSVCDEWVNDYKFFLKWAKENGWKKGLQLDKDKLGNGFMYSPSTCCWLTQSENVKYTRSATLFDYMGEKRTLTEIGRIAKINANTLRRSISKGLSLEDAINKRLYQRIK